ncbi:unnamed protein product [Leptidea sinapis]|uniref:EF-hand domain-containing protein n=1 Tax=Leptidea sinapis TaxID=189913 RepID=A0A5E4QIZ1_9NEOP|nr:unnamed protein product [Leptidea sinapis]
MATLLSRVGFRAISFNFEKTAAVFTINTSSSKKQIHTKMSCNGTVCYLQLQEARELDISETVRSLRRYSKQHGRPEENRRKLDYDSDSDSDTECKGFERSEFWRRKMRTVHNILDVDKDGLISFNDFLLFSDRFKSLGNLDEEQAKEFTAIIKLTWEEQWGAIDPYNFVTVEQYLEDMHHVLSDKTLKHRAHRWLPYLFKLFFKCLGLDNEHAAVAFAVIDTNGEFVNLGKEFFTTEDQSRVSKMFWGPLIDV